MVMRLYQFCLVSAFLILSSMAGLHAQTVTFTPTQITCHGASDATMNMELSGGTSTYWYVYINLTTPSLSDSIGPTPDHDYTFANLPPDDLLVFYVRDQATGMYVGSYIITFADKTEITANLNKTNVICYGSSTGTITISGAAGGTGVFDYTINGGTVWQPTGTFNTLPAGTYNVQVCDRNNPLCVKVLNPALQITQNAQLNATLNYTNPTCYNVNNGTITISAPTGGTGSGYQYSINGGTSWTSSTSFTNLAPGNFNVVMRDIGAPACTRTLNGALQLVQPAQLTTNISIKKGLTCYEGSDAQLQANVAGGTGPYTYDWYIYNSGWVTINQHTQVATNLGRGRYQVRVNDANGCGPVTAGIFFIEGAAFAGDSIPPAFYYDSAHVVTTCAGQNNGSITIYAHGGVSPYTYSITNGGVSGYQSPALFSNLGPGAYQTWTMDKRGCKKSGNTNVGTTPVSPVNVSIVANPAGSICPGTNVTFTATPVNGGTTPTYQWRLNGANVGANQPTYSNATLANGNQVNVILTSSLRCASNNPATSNTITATLNLPTAIGTQPQPVTSCAGTNVSFTVVATGTNLTYQWRKDGTNIAGANAATYSINNINATHAGNYSVVVTGTCGVVTSSNALLTVNPATAITTQPTPLTQCAGTNATFTVAATGTNLSYQWRKNGTNIPGANSSTYTISNIAAGDAANYSVVVSGSCGPNVTSNAVALVVNPVTVINTQPSGATQCVGTSVTFTVTAAGTNLTYQWRRNGTNIAGATSASYTIASLVAGDAGNYSVVVSGTCGPNVTSSNAVLVVNPATAINTQPAPRTVCAGTSATFTVGAVGTGLTYQWRKDGTNIPGATGTSYTIASTASGDAGNYSVVVTGTCGGSVTSNNAALVVNPVTAINSQPLPVTTCAGTPASFTVGAVGANLSYQWRKNGTNIPGATAATYTIASVAAGDAANYSVVVTGTCGSVTSSTVALTVNPPTAISAQPVPTAVCVNTPASFTVSATGINLTYQWRKNGTNIPGATGSTYTIASTVAGDAGNYSVVVSGTCGASVTSNSVALTVNPATAIGTQPVPLTQCAGTNATFTVTATGTNLTYQWRKNGTNITGATGSSYTINNIAATDAANYSVVVSGTCGGSVTSNSVALTVNPATSISVQPVALTQCAGTNATFSVTAAGISLTYQWRKNGTNIPGATGNTYTINNITATDAANYSVVVTGGCGAPVTSSNAALVVNPATAINTQPSSLVRCAGTSATFTVGATGTSLTYQWRKNGSNIPGANATSYTISAVAAADAASYDVVVSGTCGGSVTSSIATLTVNPVTSIAVQPLPATVCVDAIAQLNVTATGIGLTYQWRKNGVVMPGETSDVLTFNPAALTDAGNYSVVVSGGCGTPVTSNTVALVVNPATAINTQPSPVTACEGANASFTVSATGTALTYQWRRNGVNIPGATSATYSITGLTPAHAGNYSVVVSGGCGSSVTSSDAALVVNPTTVINTHPASVVECAGNPVSFSVDADGVSLTYQWQRNGTNIPGATNSFFSIPAVAAGNAGTYTVVVNGSCGNVTSNAATLTVNTPPVITQQPGGTTQCAGTDVTFTVGANGINLTYNWRRNGAPMVPAQTGSSLTISAIDAADAGTYDVVVTNSCGDVTSNGAALVVAENPVITLQPLGNDLCEGSDVSFTVNATGTNITYQWRKDGVNIPGATSPALQLTDIRLDDAGNYDVRVYGMCDTLASSPATLVVYPATTVDIAENDTMVCAESTVEFHADADGYGGMIYQWQLFYYGAWVDISDNSHVTGTNTPILTINNVDAADSGSYRCQVSAGCGSTYSEPVRLDVNVIIATIGTPAPFLINNSTTKIEVGVQVNNHFLVFDMGFALVAPDGTEVMLKHPIPDPCVYSSPVNVNAAFTNKLPSSDTMDYCLASNNLTGTFGAAGDWSVLNGMDPSNGAWQVRVYDQDKAVLDPDGYLVSATLRFTDLDNNGDTAIVNYNSGVISEEILNPIASELRPTSYIVPIRLSTTCFNSEDARAVVTVDGGIPPFTYQWSGPTVEAESAVVDLGPGTYTVTVTDAMGCTAEASVEVTAPPAIVFDDVQVTDTITCFGAAEGTIRAKANGGSGNFIYTLLPGNVPSSVADSGVFTGLIAGAYTVRATDINGCVMDSVVFISQHAELIVNIATVPVTGTGTGSITLTATGGTAPYLYSIDNGTTVQDSGKFVDLTAGIYHVYVEDANGCIFTEDVNLSVLALHVDVTKQDVSCPGVADGSFFLALTDGVGPYMLTGSFTDTLTLPAGAFPFTGQIAGLYDVKIEDSEGRIFMDTIEIAQPPYITATDSIVQPRCWNTDDGAIYLDVTGGTGTYTYLWSNQSTSEDLIDVAAGNYSVRITDQKDCFTEIDYALPGTIYVDADAGDRVDICPGDTAWLYGNNADSVKWSPLLHEAFINDPHNNNTWVLTEETNVFQYTVYENGCEGYDTVRVFVDGPYGVKIIDVYGGDFDADTLVYLNEGESVSMVLYNDKAAFWGSQWQPMDFIVMDTLTGIMEITPPYTVTYKVTARTWIAGCYESQDIYIVIAGDIKIYNAFSPNGDGVNDTWVIENAEAHQDDIHVQVFNRWGEPVYESKGYGGKEQWDGTRNGRMMPVGSYYYIINVEGYKPYTGTVTILR